MNTNKPYAWINVNDEYKILFDDELPNAYPTAWIPLYTHPAKELTDEEIINTLCENYDGDSGFVNRDLPKYHQSIVLFAKAILRKAQEK